MRFEPPIAAASLSGHSDASWAARTAPYVGAAFLGGIAIDGPTRTAAQAMVDRERTEFLPADPLTFIDAQLQACSPLSLQPAINVRATDLDALQSAAQTVADHDAIIELNAHCRQEEMCAVGAGEQLLHDHDRLCDQVRTAATTGATVSIKLRAEVPDTDLPQLTRRLQAAGADLVHIDAMDTETIIQAVDHATDIPIIANNGVRDRRTVAEYFEYGADAVSIGRPTDDPQVMQRVYDAVKAVGIPSPNSPQPHDS